MTSTTFSPGDKVRVVRKPVYGIGGSFSSASLAIGNVVTVKAGPDYAGDLEVYREGASGTDYNYVQAFCVEKIEEPAAEPETPVLIDLARVQALHAARAILGDAAERFDVVEVARFILGDDIDGPAAVATVDTSAPLKVEDVDGDVLKLRRRPSHNGAVAEIGGTMVYLDFDDIDRVVAYLTALKG